MVYILKLLLKLSPLPGVGHLAHEEAPELTLHPLRKFLKENS